MGHTRNFDNTLDKALACAVGGVCLAREHELNGELLVVDDTLKAFEVGEKQVGAFICGETTGESYNQRIGINTLYDRHDS